MAEALARIESTSGALFAPLVVLHINCRTIVQRRTFARAARAAASPDAA